MKFLLLLIILLATNAFASSDIYTFANTEQQTRFAELTQQFRCLVCQNETLADSNAPLAQDLRGEIAGLIQQGKSDQQITDYLVQRYGNFVLFRPPFNPTTYLLWVGPFILLISGLMLIAFLVVKRKRLEPNYLTNDEQQQLEQLLKDKNTEKLP